MQPISTGAEAATRMSTTTMPAPTMTLGWVMKRAVFGIVVLFALMGGMAWLTYTSIGPSVDEAVAAAKGDPGLQFSAQH